MRRNVTVRRAGAGALGVTALLLAACDLGEPAVRYDGVGRPLAGDIDGDGDTDLVVGATVLQNDGSGTFTQSGTVPVYPGFGPGALVDVNGDGAADRVTAAVNGERPEGGYVELADGTGGFGAPTLAFDNPNGLVLAVAAADVNGDGHVDVVVVAPDNTTSAQTSLVVRYGDGTGAFPASRSYSLATGVLADALVTVDIDEDGDLDLVARTPSADDQVMVFTNDGTGNFSPPTPYLPRSGYGSCGIVVADIDEDGHVDLLTGHTGGPNPLLLLRGDGTGAFLPPEEVPSDVAACPDQGLTTDIDGDGHLDMVTGGVKVRLGDGTGHFAEDRGLLDGWPVVADVDGDDRPDVAVVRSTATPDHPAGTYVYRNRL